MPFMLKNDARTVSLSHYVALFQKFVSTPVNGRLSLFHIDSVHQMETSLFHALLVY
jgi:carbohydrate-selective porin OprB